LLSGYHVFAGYWNKPEEKEKAFHNHYRWGNRVPEGSGKRQKTTFFNCCTRFVTSWTANWNTVKSSFSYPHQFLVFVPLIN